MKIDIGRENSELIQLQGEDLGFGPPVVLVHGWPVSSVVFEKQVLALLAAGHRVVTYDRRGFGRSSRPSSGYDFDTLADDLNCLLKILDLRECTLVGYAMGCGEVVRLLGTYGAERVARAVLVSALPPFLRQTPDNPDGLDDAVFEGIRSALEADRYDFLEAFLADAHNMDPQAPPPAVLRALWVDALNASPQAMLACVPAWQTDFRDDLPRIGVPTLVLHGSDDRVLPAKATAVPLAAAIPGAALQILEGAPHGLLWTHAEAVNRAVLDFIG